MWKELNEAMIFTKNFWIVVLILYILNKIHNGPSIEDLIELFAGM